MQFSKSAQNILVLEDDTQIASWLRLIETLGNIHAQAGRVVTVSGCFDLLHSEHIRFLETARSLGDLLIVGLNSDASVRQLKGIGRPVLKQDERAMILLALRAVDYVVIFDDLLPIAFLQKICPDIYCKTKGNIEDSVPESELLQSYGGELRILPFNDDYSILDLINSSENQITSVELLGNNQLTAEQRVITELLQGSNLLRQIADCLSDDITNVAKHILAALCANGKIMLCGNGGSAADAQHFAAELIGRFRRERPSLPAIALTVDPSILTGLANDYGFEQLFARQVQALGRPEDVLIAISTSGDSLNVLAAVRAASVRGIKTIGLTGARRGTLAELVDCNLTIPSNNTALIQQGHIAILHIICELVEGGLGECSALRI
jgi:D-sedoheptulose 7-phosphate isomerase